MRNSPQEAVRVVDIILVRSACGITCGAMTVTLVKGRVTPTAQGETKQALQSSVRQAQGAQAAVQALITQLTNSQEAATLNVRTLRSSGQGERVRDPGMAKDLANSLASQIREEERSAKEAHNFSLSSRPAL